MRRYASFAEMVSNEDSNRIMPEYSPERIISGLRQIYPPDKERLGVLVFELEVVA
jgi:ASC-1-like (ASCH) protein